MNTQRISTIPETCSTLVDSGFSITHHPNGTHEVRFTPKVDVDSIRAYSAFKANVDRAFPEAFVWAPVQHALQTDQKPTRDTDNPTPI